VEPVESIGGCAFEVSRVEVRWHVAEAICPEVNAGFSEIGSVDKCVSVFLAFDGCLLVIRVCQEPPRRRLDGAVLVNVGNAGLNSGTRVPVVIVYEITQKGEAMVDVGRAGVIPVALVFVRDSGAIILNGRVVEYGGDIVMYGDNLVVVLFFFSDDFAEQTGTRANDVREKTVFGDVKAGKFGVMSGSDFEHPAHVAE